MEFLWFVATAPARLMPILWPWLLGGPVAGAGLALLMRAFVVRQGRPAPSSALVWSATVAAGTFILSWVLVAGAVGVLLIAASASGRPG